MLSEQLTSIETMLNAMDLKAKFDQRKALLLDLDSYKRKAHSYALGLPPQIPMALSPHAGYRMGSRSTEGACAFRWLT